MPHNTQTPKTTTTKNSYCLKCLKKLQPIKADTLPSYQNWNRKYHKKCYFQKAQDIACIQSAYNEDEEEMNYRLKRDFDKYVLSEKHIKKAIELNISPQKYRDEINKKYFRPIEELQKSIMKEKVLPQLLKSFIKKNPQLIPQSNFEYNLLPPDITKIITNINKEIYNKIKKRLYERTSYFALSSWNEDERRRNINHIKNKNHYVIENGWNAFFEPNEKITINNYTCVDYKLVEVERLRKFYYIYERIEDLIDGYMWCCEELFEDYRDRMEDFNPYVEMLNQGVSLEESNYQFEDDILIDRMEELKEEWYKEQYEGDDWDDECYTRLSIIFQQLSKYASNNFDCEEQLQELITDTCMYMGYETWEELEKASQQYYIVYVALNFLEEENLKQNNQFGRISDSELYESEYWSEYLDLEFDDNRQLKLKENNIREFKILLKEWKL